MIMYTTINIINTIGNDSAGSYPQIEIGNVDCVDSMMSDNL